MRKSILTLMSIVALFVTSCVQADVDGVQTVGDEAVVSLNVATAASSSRTIADGEKATKLQYAVYDENWNHIYTAEAVTLVDRKATLELSLLTGSTYNFAFWADADKGYYTPDFVNKKVSVSYAGAEANDENRDAFYGILKVEVKGTTQASVDLKRPFAQVNFGANDLAAAKKAGFNTDSYTTKLIVSTYETLNFVDGSVEDAVEVTFAAKAPQTETATLTAGGKDYAWVSMNYVLCPEANASLSVCTMEATDGAKSVKVEYPMAPARRNWKTNLVGTLFTDSTKVEVEVTPGTGGDNTEVVVRESVSTAQELVDALGGDANLIELENDIDLNDLLALTRSVEDPTLVVNKALTINLSSYKLSATSKNTGKNYNMFNVKAGGDLTISNGTIEYKHEGENMGWNSSTNIFDVTAGGVLTLESVTAKNLGGSDMAFVAHLNNWGEVTLNVNNSTLEAPYVAVRVFNSGNDMNNVTIKNSTLKGGNYAFWVHNYTLADFNGDEAKTEAHQALLNLDIYNGTNAFVGKNNAPIRYGFTDSLYSGVVTTESELKEVLADGWCVILGSDIELDSPLEIKAGKPVVLDLNGKTLSGVDTATANFELVSLKQGANLTVQGGGKLQLSATNNRGWNAYSSVISNQRGTLLVKGGVVIEHLGGTDMAYGIDNLTNGKGTVAVTTIEDATVKSTYRAVRQFLNGIEATNELYVKNGAVIEGANKSIWMQDPNTNANTGKLVVEAGAQLKGDVYLFVTAGSTEWPVEVSIAKAALVGDSKVLTGNVPAQYDVVEENGIYVIKEYEMVAEGLYKNSEGHHLVANAEGLANLNAKMIDKTLGKGITVKLLADIDFTDKTWTPVDSHVDGAFTIKEFNGNGYTISNLTIEGQAMFTRFSNCAKGEDETVTFKDVTFDNATVNSTAINSAIIVVQTYNSTLLDNVDVKNSTIVGGYKVASLIGTVYNEDASTITATLKNCDVTDTTVKALTYDFCTTGMVAFVYADDNDKIEFENCTVSNVKLYAPNVYTTHAAIYTTGSETLFNEAEGVTVTNVTFENI